MTITETEDTIEIYWNIKSFREKYGPSDGKNPAWQEHIYPSYDKPFEWFFRDDETSDRYFSTFNHEWLTLNEIIKNIYDHTDYGCITCQRITIGDREFFDYSISSFVRVKNIYRAKKFYQALSFSEQENPFRYSNYNGYNHGAGIHLYIISSARSLTVPLHIEKEFALRSFYVRYSGRTLHSIPSKTPQV